MAHQRQQRLDQSHGRLEVDAHVPLDVGPAAVGEVHGPACARVVDEQVQRAVHVLDDLGDLQRLAGVGEVGWGNERPRRTQFLGEREQSLLAPRDQDQLHVGLAGEATRGRLADSARRAGDQSDVGHGRDYADTVLLKRCSASGTKIASIANDQITIASSACISSHEP